MKLANIFIATATLAFLHTAHAAGAQTVTETTTEVEKKDLKTFCSKKSESEAQTACQKWLDQQKASLGNRLLTAFCGSGEIHDADCLYKAQGEIKYLLRETKKETKP